MENFKDITEHQLNVGEIGVFNSMNYLAVRNNGCADCSILSLNGKRCTGHGVKCKGISFELVTKKEDIDPILESIDDTSDDDSDPVEMMTITKSEYIDLLQKARRYNEIKNILYGEDNNSRS